MAQIDSLSIVVSADTSVATKNINNLIKRLGALRNTFKTLNNISGGMKPLVKGLQSIAKIDFSGAEESLKALAEILRRIDAKKLDQMQKGVGATGAPTANTTATPTQPSSQPSQLDLATAKLTELQSMANRMSVINFDQVGNEVQMFAQQMERNVRMYGEKFVNIHKKSKILLEKVQSKIRRQYDPTFMDDNQGGNKKGFLGAFGKRVVNRLAFSLVRLIVQAIKDLIKELTSVFAKIDEGFNSVFSEFYSMFKFLKNAVMATFAPVVQLLAPLLTMIMRVLGEVLNEVAKYTAMITGQDYYYKAVYKLEDYAESLDKNNKSLSTSFDQLNVLSAEEDETANLVKVQIESNNSLKRLVDIFVNLEPLLKLIGNALFVMPLKAILSVLDMLAPYIDIIASFQETIIALWGAIFESLKAILNGDFKNLGKIWEGFAQTLMNKMGTAIINWLKGKLEKMLNWLEVIADVVMKVIKFFTSEQRTTGLANVGGNSTWDKVWKIGLGVLTGGWSLIATGTGFATGGFPEDGLFMANHNELVGKFSNGQTAVANNEQITEGIYRAVYQAMRESGGGNGGNIVIEIDGREIAKVVNRENSNMGKNFFSGGTIGYGK